jgi:hypothetical protein
MELDFVTDVRALFAADLQAANYPLPPTTGDRYRDAHCVLVDHWNARVRRIESRARAVHWSRELRAREAAIAPAIRAGLAMAEAELQSGASLQSRLSRSLNDREFNDLMLHEFGLHHLHLGTAPDARGPIARTGDLLVVLVRPDDAYLVDVRAHGCWSQQDLIEIIHVNWPIVLAPFRINIEPSDSPVTSEQRANLRRRRMNAAIEMPDGTVYAGIGGGYVRSGANLDAVRWADITLCMAEEIEKSMTGIEPQLTAELTRTTGGVPDPIRLRLVDLGEERAAIVIENANSALPVRFEVPINWALE